MPNVLKKVLAITAGATALIAMALSPAAADPVDPQATVVGVGSDTTENVMQGIAEAFNADPDNTDVLGSWNATGSSPIVTKSGCPAIPRPNGSSAGIAALLADTNNCIDFARSSRPRGSNPAENTLTFHAFARDAVTWAVHSNNTHAPASLSLSELQGIYRCEITDWGQVGGTPGVQIQPFLPQAGSGTRAFWLQQLGNITPGSCVNDAVQEHDGRPLDTAVQGGIMPYSVAQWIWQGTAQPERRANAELQPIEDGAFLSQPLGPDGRMNEEFVVQRFVYNVVKNSRVDELAHIFGPGGWICTKGDAVVARFGFAPLDDDRCGLDI